MGVRHGSDTLIAFLAIAGESTGEGDRKRRNGIGNWKLIIGNW
jgi:hypothetical protein